MTSFTVNCGEQTGLNTLEHKVGGDVLILKYQGILQWKLFKSVNDGPTIFYLKQNLLVHSQESSYS